MCIRDRRKGYYSLTPGYDMISTALLMPEDTEELALTLNGTVSYTHLDVYKRQVSVCLPTKCYKVVYSLMATHNVIV